MEDNEMAEFYISGKELRISGPPSFVKEMIQTHKNVVEHFAEKLKDGIAAANEATNKRLGNQEQMPAMPMAASSDYTDFEEIKAPTGLLEKYDNVIGTDGDKIQILTNVPGSSLPARMVNLVLIYLYIKAKLSSIERVSFNELRAFCEIHGELDGAHFAAIVKKNKKWFLLDSSGPGKSISAKITVPGIKEAERLLDLMNK